MRFAGLIERWWSRLRGHEAARVTPPARPQSTASADGTAAGTGKRSKAAASDDDELQLVDQTKPGQPGKRKARRAGFDPYSSDAGYQKPHGWDRVDRN